MTEKIEEALNLYYALAEAMKFSVPVMQTLAECCDDETADGLRCFIALCRRTRSTPGGGLGRAVRTALKQADRAKRRGGGPRRPPNSHTTLC